MFNVKKKPSLKNCMDNVVMINYGFYKLIQEPTHISTYCLLALT